MTDLVNVCPPDTPEPARTLGGMTALVLATVRRVALRVAVRRLVPTFVLSRDPSAPRFSAERPADGSRHVEVRVGSWLLGIYSG